MIRLKHALLTSAALVFISTPVLAQSADDASKPAADPSAQTASSQSGDETVQEQPTAVEEVVVRGASDGIRTSIDAISYSLANDLQATTGSLADALRNVPSVDVDPEGNVSLRGDSSVTILVDGRPSGILSGPGRSQAIQQLPADQYARIEVMTNPSAAYSPEGGGGVINLITKPSAPRPGQQTSGSVRVNVGDNGRYNLGVNGSYQKDKLTLSGDVSYRYDANEFLFPTYREALDNAGNIIGTTDLTQDSGTRQNGSLGRLTAEYNLTERTQVTGELRATLFDVDPRNVGTYRITDGAGNLTESFNIANEGAAKYKNLGATGRVLHRFDTDGHEWSNEVRFDRQTMDNDFMLTSDWIVPVRSALYEKLDSRTATDTLGFTSAYTRPMGDNEKLRLGYEFTRIAPDEDTVFSRGPSPEQLVLVPGQTNRFEGEQIVHALYSTYERPLTDKLSVQAGLRLEQAEIEVADLTGGRAASQDYFRAYPTGHLQYQLSESQTLRASYSRRIQRPQLTQLNPFEAYRGPLLRTSGNPDLEPQETDAYEAMWQMRQGPNFYQATLYYRDTDKAFTDVAMELGDGIILTRPENLGARRDMGVELTASGRLHPTLRYSASANIYRQDIEATNIVNGRDRDGNVVSGRFSLNWQPTDKDFAQLTGFWQGETLLAQGTREAGGMVNLGYRRKLTDSLSLNVTGRDLFNSFKNTVRYDTPTFREVSEQHINLRAFYIGLTWQLGSGPRRQPEQFDFSTGPTGG